MDEEKKAKELKKAKMVYSGELLVFAVIFVVIGILILTGVITIKDWKRIFFSYATLIGGAWLIVDFVWTLASKKRRARKPLIDKIIVLPAALTVIGFDIYAFANGLVHSDVTSPLFAYFIGGDLCYLSLVYVFEGLYHYKHPLPEIIEAVEEDAKNETKPAEEKPVEPTSETKTEEPKEKE